MISFEFHLKNRHEKTRKPLWFPGFQPRYLFRCYLLVAGVGFFIARSKTHSPPFANSIAGSPPRFLPCVPPFSAAGGGHAPSPLPPPSGLSVPLVPADKKKKTPMRLFLFVSRRRKRYCYLIRKASPDTCRFFSSLHSPLPLYPLRQLSLCYIFLTCG